MTIGFLRRILPGIVAFLTSAAAAFITGQAVSVSDDPTMAR
jgi:hypothetical protein